MGQKSCQKIIDKEKRPMILLESSIKNIRNLNEKMVDTFPENGGYFIQNIDFVVKFWNGGDFPLSAMDKYITATITPKKIHLFHSAYKNELKIFLSACSIFAFCLLQ